MEDFYHGCVFRKSAELSNSDKPGKNRVFQDSQRLIAWLLPTHV